MKIAIIADPEIPVPPLLYGGIERIIHMLIEQYMYLGHEVSLFAHADSITNAKLIRYHGKTSTGKLDLIKNMWTINLELTLNKYDIIHSFGRLLYLLPQLASKTPKIMSYQREPTTSQISRIQKIARKNSIVFTGCSRYISDKIRHVATSFPIYNGVDLKKYDFQSEVPATAPLIFLGRIEPIKGTHIAIEVAKSANKKLLIAGNVPIEFGQYFKEQIESELNENIRYIGPVNDIEKNKLLGTGLALLMPIEWDEPFGIVMAEAMACGTPVIGFRKGSVPEVVSDGVNGFICDSVKEMCSNVNRITELDRYKVRQDCEKRFSSRVISQQYLNLYEKMIHGT